MHASKFGPMFLSLHTTNRSILSVSTKERKIKRSIRFVCGHQRPEEASLQQSSPATTTVSGEQQQQQQRRRQVPEVGGGSKPRSSSASSSSSTAPGGVSSTAILIPDRRSAEGVVRAAAADLQRDEAALLDLSVRGPSDRPIDPQAWHVLSASMMMRGAL
jgi:hypothetical protein